MSIIISRSELAEVSKIVENFGVSRVTLVQDDSSGIGSILDVEFEYTVNGMKVKIIANVSSEDSW